MKHQAYGTHWEDQSWHEVLRLICGMINERFAGEIIDYLAHTIYQPWPEDFDDRPPWNVALAVQCLGELKNITSVESTARSLLQTCCKLFQRIMDEQEEELPGFLDKVLAPSAKAIGGHWPGSERIVEWFVTDIKPVVPSVINYYRSHSCGMFMGAVGVNCIALCDHLMTLIDSDPHGGAQCFVAHTLSEYRRGHRKNFELLYHCFSEASDIVARAFAVKYLAENGTFDTQTLPLLHDWAVNDAASDVRQAAVEALAQHYRTDAQTLPLLHDRAVNDESPAEDAQDYDWLAVRKVALEAVATYWPEHPETLPLLRERAKNDQTPWLRERARQFAEALQTSK